MTDFPSDARNDLCSKEKLYNMLLIIIGSLLAKRQISMSERHNLHLILFFFLTPKRSSQVKK